MDIKHIVVGTDFSDEADAAAKQSLGIARRTGAQITLVHACPVVEPPSRTVTTQWSALMQRHLSTNRKRLEELRVSMSGQGPEISHMVVDDVPDAGLASSATDLDAQLIAVGTRGFTGVKHLLLGSVAEKVVRRSPVSVLVARPSSNQAQGGYHHILVPTDFSDAAEFALQSAVALAAEGARIEVWHWWHSPYGGPLPDPESLRQEIESSTHAAGETLVERYRAPHLQMSFGTAEAPPNFGIQQRLTAGGDYDLVVTGSHGRHGVTRWLIGSVAEATVRHAPCSVLVARAPVS
ncbi:universal stress protein [Haliangium sp.]|uniref:universal stress protein n=1 Tax=Haliangium sp. TaxID=2663208 RepID=UPI003D12C6D5